MSDKPDDIGAEEAAQSKAVARNREQLDQIGALLAEAQVLWEAMPDDDQSLIESVGGAWSGVGAHISEANSAFRKLDDLPAVDPDPEDSDTIIAFFADREMAVTIREKRTIISFEHQGVDSRQEVRVWTTHHAYRRRRQSAPGKRRRLHDRTL